MRGMGEWVRKKTSRCRVVVVPWHSEADGRATRRYTCDATCVDVRAASAMNWSVMTPRKTR